MYLSVLRITEGTVLVCYPADYNVTVTDHWTNNRSSHHTPNEIITGLRSDCGGRTPFWYSAIHYYSIKSDHNHHLELWGSEDINKSLVGWLLLCNSPFSGYELHNPYHYPSLMRHYTILVVQENIKSMSGFIAMVCKNVLGVMMGNKYEGKMFISGNYDHLFRYNKQRNDYCGKYIWLCRHFSMQKCT